MLAKKRTGLSGMKSKPPASRLSGKDIHVHHPGDVERFYSSSRWEKEVNCPERIYISYRQRGRQKVKWGQLWERHSQQREGSAPVISCGQQSAKPSCKQEVEALALDGT